MALHYNKHSENSYKYSEMQTNTTKNSEIDPTD